MPPKHRSSLSPVLVLALGLVVSGAVTLAVERITTGRDRLRFDNVLHSAHDRIELRVHAYEAVLRSSAAIFALNQTEVTRDEFGRFVESLDVQRVYPGIQGVGFIQRATAADAPALVDRLRQQGVADFKVWPDSAREERFAITLIEPLDRRNRAALGYDMTTEPVRREAMERARDSGAPALSGKVTLVQEVDEDKQAGFLVYVPVYSVVRPATVEERRRSLKGFVYAPFRADDFLEGIFGTEAPRVSITVFDGPDATDAALLHAPEKDPHHVPRYTTLDALMFGGHRWTMRYETTTRFEEGSARPIVVYVAIGALVVTLLMFLIARRLRRAADAAAASERNLEALFTQAPAAVAVLRGADFRYELSNPANQLLAGGVQLVGRTAREVFPTIEAEGLIALLENVYKTGEPFYTNEIQLDLRNPDGSKRTVYVRGTYQPLRAADGAIDGVMAFAFEVTEQVLARQKAEALAEDLAGAVRVRDDFLSIAGHELKTPLAALMLQLQALMRQAEKVDSGALAPELHTRLEKALKHTRRLGGLVEELLDVSRLTSGRLTLQLDDVDLAEVCRDVVERFADQAQRENAPLELALPERLVGHWDRVRVEQVVSNLIANALKYGAGKPIRISLESTEGRAVLHIQDRGIGIKPEDIERIFGRFERAVSERNYGGLGLGLWISRQIVEALHGSIVCNSAEGAGSTFTVELPLSQG